MPKAVTPLSGAARQDLQRLKGAVKKREVDNCRVALGKLKRQPDLLQRALSELRKDEREFLEEHELIAA